MQHFIRKHPVQSILLTLLAAYGLWWLGNDIALRTYPQRVARTIIAPPNVKLVDSGNGYLWKCKTSGIIQYFTTNESWDTIILYYTTHLPQTWQARGDELGFYQIPGEHELLTLSIERIDVTIENYREQRTLFTGSTNYYIGIQYKQDVRLYDTICKPTD